MPPQVCIVGIGKTIIQPTWINNAVQPRSIINVSFGCDHRILDGATIARFANKWKGFL